MNKQSNDGRIYLKLYNPCTKECGVLPVDSTADKKIFTRMFFLEYGKDGWVIEGQLDLEGGDDE
jgi:hypothetical protein